MRMTVISIAVLMGFGFTATAESDLAHHGAVRHSPNMELVDPYTLVGPENLMKIAPLSETGTVTAIVEIPTGTSAKWELDKDNPDTIIWEFRDDKPRVVKYLGYPGNYGFIPGTALPKALGGDGDPLDVLVLGQAAPRGAVLEVRLIGVLKMLDDGEQDDKLIAVMVEGSAFSEIESMAQLDADYSGVSDIVSVWFRNYKGPEDGMLDQGFREADEAIGILEKAIASFAVSE